MKILLTFILSFLMSGFFDGQTEDALPSPEERSAYEALCDIIYPYGDESRPCYPYNFGGAKQEDELLTIYITNDDTSPYEDISAFYYYVQFEQVEYSLIELEVIGNLFIAAHPEIADLVYVSVSLTDDIAYIDVTKLDADTQIQLEADMEGLPLSTIIGVYIF